MQGSIHFHTEDSSFHHPQKSQLIPWVKNSISKEGKKASEINIVFCSDSYLHDLNKTYLNHDTFTDIITFDYCEDDLVSGDIFISIDRVKENAKTLEIFYLEELNRVIIHGILHLLGYKDKSQEEKDLMREKEDFYLTLQPQKNPGK